MAVPWSESADKHNVPRDEALYALSHARAIFPNFQAARRLQPFAHAVHRSVPVRHVGGHRHCYPTHRRTHLPRHAPTRVDPQKCRLRGRRPVMANDPTIPTKAEIEDLAQWAEAGEFDPNFAGGKALHGAAAAAAGRAMLEAAGVDVDAVERAVGGRPRLDPAAPRGAAG